MATKPILFSTEMVEAILDERKTQIRRVKKSETSQYQVGDVLWVRETWAEFGNGFIYKADQFQEYEDTEVKWKPSIHMPKKVARIFLKVTNIRCERLQDISEDDAYEEGLIAPEYWDGDYDSHRKTFKMLWCNLYGEQTWYKNPFVWVYEFKIVEKSKDF